MDRKRDRSSHTRDDERREPRSAREREVSQAAKQAYLKKLDEKLFSGKGPSAVREAEAVREARGTRDFSAACDVYVERNGFPDAPALLLLFLDHENPEVALRAIETLSAQAREKRVDRDALVKALRRVKTMTDDADVESAAEDLLDSL
jgi:hypothetical protein